MNRASTHLTVGSSDMIATSDRSALGVDAPIGTHDPEARGLALAVAPIVHAPPSVDIDAVASLTTDEVLTFTALCRATRLALARCRTHLGGPVDALMAIGLMYAIATDADLDPVLDDQADALLAHADSLLHAVPSEPSDDVAESERLADLFADDAAEADPELAVVLAAGRDAHFAPVEIKEAA